MIEVAVVLAVIGVFARQFYEPRASRWVLRGRLAGELLHAIGVELVRDFKAVFKRG